MASVRTDSGFFVIFCLLSTLSTADLSGSFEMEMYTIPKILATCGQNLTLECDIAAEKDIEIKTFFWMEKQEICFYETENQTGPDFECRGLSYTKNSERYYNYSLTIFNVQPKHKGTYHCKLRSKQGVLNGKTIVRVQKCVGNTSTDVTPTEGSCSFKDVFPEPVVFWNQGLENLTHLAETKVMQSAEGLFSVVSKIELKKDPSNPDHYNCSLWMPLENDKNETQVQFVRAMSFSDAHKLCGHLCGVMLPLLSLVFLA
ncbi:unnamed protein product [Knipowitschia caucasica]|uniref:Ig-like domain-containing protein n=1 Tax=Knipowitschia caucasica TaxID=637954 RepID=A0AAV2KJ23_KNICA